MTGATDRSLELAIAAHRAGSLDVAEKAYLEILTRRANHPQATGMLGVLRAQQGRATEAVSLLEQAVSTSPDDPMLLNNLGNVHKLGYRYAEAEHAYRRVLQLWPTHLEARINLGLVLREQGDLDGAYASLRAALDQDPDSLEALNNMGNVLYAQGKLAEAEASLRRATTLRTGFVEAFANLGRVLLEQQKFTEASAAYARVAELAPGSALADFCRGRDAASRHQYVEAELAFRDAMSKRPNYLDAINGLAIALRAQGRLTESMSACRQAIALRPDFPDLYFNLAAVYADRKMVTETLETFNTILKLNPNYGDAYRALAFYLYKLGRHPEAAKAFGEWERVEPNQPIAAHMRAACSGTDTPDRASASYVQTHFDHFAKTFDSQLGRLKYRGPELVVNALSAQVGEGTGTLDILDAGCGTGLCGPLVRPWARRLVGLDLSPRMLEHAAGRKIYDELIEADLLVYGAEHPELFDAIIAADSYIYFGQLTELLHCSAAMLRPEGWLVFSLEAVGADDVAGGDFRLHPHGRYAHSLPYVQRVLDQTGFQVLGIESAVIRFELGVPVLGHVVTARKEKR